MDDLLHHEDEDEDETIILPVEVIDDEHDEMDELYGYVQKHSIIYDQYHLHDETELMVLIEFRVGDLQHDDEVVDEDEVVEYYI